MAITLITGTNTGLGRDTARPLNERLSELGHTVLVGARNRDHGAEAAEKPSADSGRFVDRTGEIARS